jgi:hypothetical protein
MTQPLTCDGWGIRVAPGGIDARLRFVREDVSGAALGRQDSPQAAKHSLCEKDVKR